MNEFFFIVYPYIALTLFIAVPIIRRRRGGFAFTTRASGFFERPSMGIAAVTFHWGIITLFAAHIMGLIGGLTLSSSWIDAFHWIGLAAGLCTLYGATLALLRRIVVPELRASSRYDDYLILVLLIPILVLGLYPVIVDKTFGLSLTAAPWVKGIVTLSPDIGGMAGLPLITKLHVVLALTFIAFFPFTKLVHMWTVPLGYVVRPFQSMRTYRRA
ncbi:MAG: respiratory nitrate reductase subunit gamma [Solirubrobacterales bacterium]